MNIQNYYDNFIDAKNEFIGGNGTSGDISGGISGDTLNNYIYLNNSSNLYITNSNVYGDINFKTLFSYSGSNNGVFIDYTGRLKVYHNYKIIQPFVPSGYLDVEDELAGVKQSTIVADAEMVIVQSEIAGITTTLLYHTSEISRIGTELEIHRNIIQTLVDYDYYENLYFENIGGSLDRTIATAQALQSFVKRKALIEGILGGITLVVFTSLISRIYQMIELDNIKNVYSNVNSNILYDSERGPALSNITNAQINNYIALGEDFCNLNISNGFINKNIQTNQFIPTLKSNKIMLGNITTPNGAYQMEMTGNLNLNMLYLNSTPLTTFLNQKQGNLTFNNPLLNTINIVSLKRDASLTLDGSGNLSVVKTASAPLSITGNNWSLNYDSTLTLNGNSLSIASTNTSKWTQLGNNIYNKNSGNVGIGINAPEDKIHLHRELDTRNMIKITNYITGIGGYAGYFGFNDNQNLIMNYTNANGYSGINIKDTGMVGINNTSPSHMLDVNGNIKSSGNIICSGNVGIKTNVPYSSLDVWGGATFNDGITSIIYNVNNSCSFLINNVNSGSSALIDFQMNNNSGTAWFRLYSSTSTNPNKLLIQNTITNAPIELKSGNAYIIVSGATGNIGIGNNSSSSYKLSVAGNISCSGIDLGAGNLTNASSITATNFYGYLNGNISGNAVSATTSASCSGNSASTNYFRGHTGTWHNSTEGTLRFYFASGSHTYFCTGSSYIFRQPDTVTDCCQINSDGIKVNLLSISITNTDMVCAQMNQIYGNYNYLTLRTAFDTFTGFHRCFIQDELFNINNHELFKNDYEGRIVVSIGKIKTERRDLNEIPDWTIFENKEAIHIEEAIPIIQLSRKRKDKTVYGVLGSSTRKNSSNDRLIVNSLGEGAIWVVNSNGNLENGDLLQTSDYLGYAEKQDDDIIRNYTIGKIVMDCKFELNSPYYKCEVIDAELDLRRAFVACVYYCG